MNARVRLVFPEDLVRQPIIAKLVRTLDVDINIRRANIEEHSGWIVCELDGDQAAVNEAMAWLSEVGIRVEQLSDVVEG